MEGVASTTDAGWRRGEVENGFQLLVLEVDMDNTPEGGVHFEVEFQGAMEMRGIEEGVERVATVFLKGSFTEAMGGDGNIDR